jgi:hypothetical protein
VDKLNEIDKWLRSFANNYNKKANDYEIDIANKIKNDLYDAINN